jgi:hypothetical protein
LLVAFLPIMQDTNSVTGDAQTAAQQMLHRLKGKLSTVLPSYMIPSEFIVVDNIPMTTTAKRTGGNYGRNSGI